jgi:CheY-like chemotaxis protein
MDTSITGFDLRQILDDIAATIQPLAESNRNTLELIAPDAARLVTDETKLRQILLNLLSNACKFTGSGTVKLTADIREAGDEELLLVSVEDTGIGMSPEHVESLFQPFVQADASTSRKYGGTGLGLAISRRIAHLLGGDLTVESAPGKGSTFRLWIPTILGEDSGNSVAAFAMPAAGTAEDERGGSVVIVDNDSDARALLSWLVLKHGLRPIPCRDAESGIEAVRRHRPRAVVLDVLLPGGMDGWTALGAFKQDPELAGIPVMMVTIDDDASRARSLGAFAHLTKPLDTAAFQQALEQCRMAAGAVPAAGRAVDERERRGA